MKEALLSACVTSGKTSGAIAHIDRKQSLITLHGIHQYKEIDHIFAPPRAIRMQFE